MAIVEMDWNKHLVLNCSYFDPDTKKCLARRDLISTVVKTVQPPASCRSCPLVIEHGKDCFFGIAKLEFNQK